MYGDRIKELREERGWSQHELANKLHCNPRTIGKYEQELLDLRTGNLIALCHIFQVSSDYILGLEDETGAKIYR